MGVCSASLFFSSSKKRKKNIMSREWRIGLCGCCTTCGSCFDNTFCIPCQLSRHCQALDNQRDTCSLPMCVGFFCCMPLASIFICMTRRKIIEKYNIDEGMIGSCCRCICCGPLLMCQHHHELTGQGMWPGGTCCEKQPPIS